LPKPLESYVKQILAENDRGSKIFQALHFGWEALGKQADKDWWRRKSTRAAVVWENTIEKAIELLGDDEGVQVIAHYDTISFILDDAILIRFKKADLSLRTSNAQTELADLFHDHDSDLFGYSGLQRVEAVYVLNRFETEVIWAGIVARKNDVDLWHFELTPERVEVPALPLPEHATGDTASLAKLKTTAKKKAIRDTNGDVE